MLYISVVDVMSNKNAIFNFEIFFTIVKSTNDNIDRSDTIRTSCVKYKAISTHFTKACAFHKVRIVSFVLEYFNIYLLILSTRKEI